MDAVYQITADRFRGTMRVTMGGFFSKPDVEAFVRELRMKLALLGTEPNAHMMLCDVRRMKIQTQEIVAAFTGVVGHPSLRSRRLAFVTGSSLARLQTRRLTDRPGVAFFDTIEAAEAWLFEEAETDDRFCDLASRYDAGASL